MNVGLDTSSGVGADAAREAADERRLAGAEVARRAAPRRPARASRRSRSPAADVSSSLRVIERFDGRLELRHAPFAVIRLRPSELTSAVRTFFRRRAVSSITRVAEARGDVAGDERHFPFVGFGEIAGGAVQVDGQLARRFGVEQLREPGRDHPGQQVAGAAGRHAGVAGQVDERAALRAGDDRAMPLEHDVDAMGGGKLARVLEPIVLHRLDR